ncbi:MAG: ParB/RepB/Spo0J family partition protein [Candidatus Eremiobacteraeota bacterium]|nr:ParB/RepB/Spo0J family partition protein [Candidatus Eremiobacteraeota bacterium]
MNKPRGLGRGLGALFPASEKAKTAASTLGGGLVQIPIEQIKPNPHQPRKHFDEESLTALAQSIRAHGLLAPILVRRDSIDPASYEIITGERRWRAVRLAGQLHIDAVVREAQAGEAVELAMLENVQRADLNAIEEAAGYRQLIEEHGYTQEGLAQRIGKSRPAVANALRLLTLPDSVQALVRDGKLSAGHARALAALPHARARQLAGEAVRSGLSVRDLERKSAERQAKNGKKQSPPAPASTHLTPEMAEAENRLRFALATRVALRPRQTGGGTIEVHYVDDGELTRILDRIAPQEY